MNAKLLKAFFRDHLDVTVIYFVSHLLVSVYSYHFISNRIQIMYMLSIYLYLFILFTGYRLIKYVSTHKEMMKLADHSEVEEKNFSCEQLAVIQMIQNIQQTYQEKIYEVKAQSDNTHRFISQLIHSLKTPLSVIDLIIQNYKLDRNDKDAMQHIEEEKELILGMLNQVLKLFRLENFSRDYIPENVNLLESLRTLINTHKNQFIYSNVYPSIECEFDSVMVLTDSKWNTAILEQIISNAIKYSASKTDTKYVYFRFDMRGNRVLLTVRDEGVGIEKVDLDRVFQPFFTGRNGRISSQATGIGLYICSEIAKKLGHRLEISSEIGRGTEVTISYLSKMKDSVT